MWGWSWAEFKILQYFDESETSALWRKSEMSSRSAHITTATSVNILPAQYHGDTFRQRNADALLHVVGLPIYKWDHISVANE